MLFLPEEVSTTENEPTWYDFSTTEPALLRTNKTNLLPSATNGTGSSSSSSSKKPNVGMQAGLALAAIFGCIFGVAVIVLVSKRVYEGWQKRHYTRMDYLINGMYN